MLQVMVSEIFYFSILNTL